MSEEEKPSVRIEREVTAELEKEEKKVRGALETKQLRVFTEDEWRRVRCLEHVKAKIMADVETISIDAIGTELDREWDRRRAWEKKIELELERMGKDIHGG